MAEVKPNDALPPGKPEPPTDASGLDVRPRPFGSSGNGLDRFDGLPPRHARKVAVTVFYKA
jgi:hypothetical protein